MTNYERSLGWLRDNAAGYHNGDFLQTWDMSLAQLKTTATVAQLLRELWNNGHSAQLFRGGLAVSNFRDQSTRTRFSFASAASLLGLTLVELDEAKSQIAHGETVRETASMISFLTEVLGIRDDIYLGEGHRYMKEVASALDESHQAGVLAQRPAVVNLQCDRDHPTQAMSDLCQIQRYFGCDLEGLAGKRLAMSWAYSPSYGKPLSVPQGVIGLCTRFGMDVTLAYPEGYELIPEIVELSATQSAQSGGRFQVVHSMAQAFRDADIVYPKSWAPMVVMEQRTQLLRGDLPQAQKQQELKALEQNCLAQNARHTDWECDAAKMALTRNGSALYMHCLPADITGVSCKQGEVSADVFEKARLETYHEASYKPFIIAAMIVLARIADPAAALEGLVNPAISRHP